jgi:hypothetical protein
MVPEPPLMLTSIPALSRQVPLIPPVEPLLSSQAAIENPIIATSAISPNAFNTFFIKSPLKTHQQKNGAIAPFGNFLPSCVSDI